MYPNEYKCQFRVSTSNVICGWPGMFEKLLTCQQVSNMGSTTSVFGAATLLHLQLTRDQVEEVLWYTTAGGFAMSSRWY